MANSLFNNNGPDIAVPVVVSNGGTGCSSFPNNSILVGAGAFKINHVSLPSAGYVITSNGAGGWFTEAQSPGVGAITYSKLASDLVDRVSITESNIDWSIGAIYTKTLTENTTLTFSNYRTNKTITLIISGDYTLSFPSSVKVVNGVYDGTVSNYITLHCISSDSGSEIVWMFINNI